MVRPLNVCVNLPYGRPLGQELLDARSPVVRDAVVPAQPPVVLGGARRDAPGLLQALE